MYNFKNLGSGVANTILIDPQVHLVIISTNYSCNINKLLLMCFSIIFLDRFMSSAITYDPNCGGDLLGSGSGGTYVFRGKYTWKVTGEVETVAIKQILKAPGSNITKEILREVKALQLLHHENIIQYIDVEDTGLFVLIVLQLCSGSLANVLDVKKDVFGDKFDKKYKIHLRPTKKSLLMDVARGLDYIHSRNIIHRDLKPQNILVTKDSKCPCRLKAVISDFGLCREFSSKCKGLNPSKSLIGSQGWMSKEILLKKKNIVPPTAVDIFAYGCIVHFVLSFKRAFGQIHPFGSDDARNQNIRTGARVVYLYENINEVYFSQEKHTAYGDTIIADILVDACVHSDPKVRLSAEEALEHPFFWDYSKRIKYVCKHFNNLKEYTSPLPDMPTSPSISSLEELWKEFRSGQDLNKCITEVWCYLNLYSQNILKKTVPDNWNISLFDGLMRAIRNLSEHWASAITVYPELKSLFSDSEKEGNCDLEKMGIYFFERVHKCFPVIFVYFLAHDKHHDSNEANTKLTKIVESGKKTLRRVLKSRK